GVERQVVPDAVVERQAGTERMLGIVLDAETGNVARITDVDIDAIITVIGVITAEVHADITGLEQRVLLFRSLEHFLQVFLLGDVGFLLLQRLAGSINGIRSRGLTLFLRYRYKWCRSNTRCQQPQTQCFPDSAHCLILYVLSLVSPSINS